MRPNAFICVLAIERAQNRNIVIYFLVLFLFSSCDHGHCPCIFYICYQLNAFTCAHHMPSHFVCSVACLALALCHLALCSAWRKCICVSVFFVSYMCVDGGSAAGIFTPHTLRLYFLMLRPRSAVAAINATAAVATVAAVATALLPKSQRTLRDRIVCTAVVTSQHTHTYRPFDFCWYYVLLRILCRAFRINSVFIVVDCVPFAWISLRCCRKWKCEKATSWCLRQRTHSQRNW